MPDTTVTITETAQQRIREANEELNNLVLFYGQDNPMVCTAYRSFCTSLQGLMAMGGTWFKAFDFDGIVANTAIGMTVGMVRHRASLPDDTDKWIKANGPEPCTWSLHS